MSVNYIENVPLNTIFTKEIKYSSSGDSRICASLLRFCAFLCFVNWSQNIKACSAIIYGLTPMSQNTIFCRLQQDHDECLCTCFLKCYL